MMKKGSELHPEDKKYVLSAYIHRYTGNHKPRWVVDSTPLHFLDDNDWLDHTFFYVRKNGRLDKRYHRCESYPTYPNNPEHRKQQTA